MARDVSEFELYNDLESWLRGCIDDAWSVKAVFGDPVVPIPNGTEYAKVRCFSPDGGGVTAAGTAHQEMWTWSFDIGGRFDLSRVTGDVLPYQMTMIHRLISRIAPYTRDRNNIPVTVAPPVAGMTAWWVAEFGPLDVDLVEKSFTVFLQVKVDTEVFV